MNDFEIYKKAALILRTGENVALITVIATEGSTPGKVGYKMLLWAQNAQTIGTVGGGMVEAEIIDIAKGILPKAQILVRRFSFDGLTNNERGICGVSMEVLIETFDQKDLPLFEDLSAAIGTGQKGSLVSIISPQTAPKKLFVSDAEQFSVERRAWSVER